MISSLAENPKGRALSEKYIDKINNLKTVDKKYIDAAIGVIKWKPWHIILYIFDYVDCIKF